MIDIYICEDNPKYLEFIRKRVEDIILFEGLDMQIGIASSDPEKILEQAKQSENGGLYFLDIELKDLELNGFLLAQMIRKIEPRCFIVFITAHFELSYFTYQYKVEALDFILKGNPETVKTRIHECILNAYEKHTCTSPNHRHTFTITMCGDKLISLEYSDIIFIEINSVNHKLIVQTAKRRLEFSGKLNDIEKELNNDFFRCHRSAIVNINNIDYVDYKNNKIIMNDSSICPLSTRKKNELKSILKKENV